MKNVLVFVETMSKNKSKKIQKPIVFLSGRKLLTPPSYTNLNRKFHINNNIWSFNIQNQLPININALFFYLVASFFSYWTIRKAVNILVQLKICLNFQNNQNTNIWCIRLFSDRKTNLLQILYNIAGIFQGIWAIYIFLKQRSHCLKILFF